MFSWCKSNPDCFPDETAEAKEERVTFPSPALSDIRCDHKASARNSAFSRAVSRESTTSNTSPAIGTIFNPMTCRQIEYQEPTELDY